MLLIDIYFSDSDNKLSTERHLFPSLNAALSVSHSVSTQAAIFRFNEAIYKTLTNLMVSHQMQTEVVRKFTATLVLALSPRLLQSLIEWN